MSSSGVLRKLLHSRGSSSSSSSSSSSRSSVILLQQIIAKRGVATKSYKVAAPVTTAQVSSSSSSPSSPFGGNDIFWNNLATRQTPPCGWTKMIVSSSSSLAKSDNDTESALSSSSATTSTSTPTSLRDVSFAKEALVEGAEADGLNRLEVDMEALQDLASMRCTPLSLKDMYKYAVDFNDQEQRLRNAQFLHKELPIRIAQRAVDLLTLPHGLSDALPIRQIAHVYLLYLEKFQQCPVPTTSEQEEIFTDMLQSMVLDRTAIPNAIAKGVDTWIENDAIANNSGGGKTGDGITSTDDAVESIHEAELRYERLQEMEDALYRFFTARVGLRFLTEHHILSSPSRASSDNIIRKSQSSFAQQGGTTYLGCIQTNCDPTGEVQKVAETVVRQTKEYYGFCPEIQVVDSTQNTESKFTYVEHHLHYMVGELLKNSCRATIKKYMESENTDSEDNDNDSTTEKTQQQQQIPPIRVVIVKGDEDVTIKIADRGGGIPRSKMTNIWKFAHSTANAEEENETDFGLDEVTGTKIRGFGLPLARIYARYLGGELTLKSMEGYGLDAYLHLPRLGDSCENLPLPVKFSPGELNSNPPRRRLGN